MNFQIPLHSRRLNDAACDNFNKNSLFNFFNQMEASIRHQRILPAQPDPSCAARQAYEAADSGAGDAPGRERPAASIASAKIS